MLKKVLIALGVLAALGGFGVALRADKQRCEALHGKVEVGPVVLEPHSGEYELRLEVVLERKGDLASWKAEYAGKAFGSADKPGREVLVRQHGRESRRAGFLGSDLKRLYGADYKLYSYKFYVRKLDQNPPKQVVLSAVFKDPVKGEIKFKQAIELK